MAKNFPHDVDTANRDQPTKQTLKPSANTHSHSHTHTAVPQSPHPLNVTIEDLVKSNCDQCGVE